MRRLYRSLLSPIVEAHRVPPGGGATNDDIVAQLLRMGLGVVFGYGKV